MKIIILLVFISSLNLYSYSLGIGFSAGGGAKEIKALEATAKCGDCVNNFTYNYKLGATIINKFQLSETIFVKVNLSLLKFNIDFDKSTNNPFLIKTDIALEFYPLKEILEGFYFGGGLFINYFLTYGFSELNNHFSMLSAFIDSGYKIPLTKNISFYGEISSEIFDIISTKTKTRAFIGVSSNLYFLYKF